MSVAKCCVECGAEFSCGRDDASCWCVTLPALPRALLVNGADCLCATCLNIKLKQARNLSPAESDGQPHDTNR